MDSVDDRHTLVTVCNQLEGRALRTSMRTFVIGLVGLGAIAVVRTLVVLGVGGPMGPTISSDLGEAAVVLSAAVLVLFLASRLRDHTDRLLWMLLGSGALAFALGDVVWATIELGTGVEPYPGLPDLFYMLEYAFVCIALGYAGYRLRDGAEARSAFLIAGLTCVVALGTLFLGLIEPLLLPASISPLELALSVFYPIADVVFLVTPAVFLMVIAFRSGDRRVFMPWGVVAIGMVLLAMTDATFSWLSAYGLYSGGSIVDYGWMAAHVALVVGCSLALDAEFATARSVAREAETIAAVTPATDVRPSR